MNAYIIGFIYGWGACTIFFTVCVAFRWPKWMWMWRSQEAGE